MKKTTTLILKIVLYTGFLFNVLVAQAMKPVMIKKETNSYIMDIKYPQDFKSSAINLAIKNYIEQTQNYFLKDLSQDADTPADAPGKTGLNVVYSIPFKSDNTLSVRFDISIYHKGAAHPLNTVVVKNFIQGKEVVLSDIFVAGTGYLKLIASISAEAITEKKISEAQWIIEGTKPNETNYQVWTFTKKGLDIIFNSYQVAAYVYGPQTVHIPLDTLSPLLKPAVAKTVWGH